MAEDLSTLYPTVRFSHYSNEWVVSGFDSEESARAAIPGMLRDGAIWEHERPAVAWCKSGNSWAVVTRPHH